MLHPARASALNAEQATLAAEARQLVRNALAELNADQRAAVIMHHLVGMSVAEIAGVMKVRPGTIMSRLARARETLRERLAQLVEESDEPVRSA